MEHSFENSSVRKAWGIENNQSNNKNIPVMQTARSLEFVKSRHSNSQIKAYEPERWSHDDATLSNTGSSYNNSSNNMMASENFYNSNNNVSPYYGSNNTSNINPYYNSQGYPIPAEINIQQQQMRQMQQQQQQQQQQLRQMQPRQNGNDYRNNNYSSYSSTSSEIQNSSSMNRNEDNYNPQVLSQQQQQKQQQQQQPQQSSFDDIPLPTTISGPSKPKTFEEILAENLNGVDDPSAIAPKSAEQPNQQLNMVNTKTTTETTENSSKKKVLKKNSRNWYKPAPRYRKGKKKITADTRSNQQKSSQHASIDLNGSDHTLPPPPPVSPYNETSGNNAQLYQFNNASKSKMAVTNSRGGNVGIKEKDIDQMETDDTTSTEMAFLSLLEKGKKEQQDDELKNMHHDNDGKYTDKNNNNNNTTVNNPRDRVSSNIEETEDAWGSIDQRSFAKNAKK